MYYEKYGKRDLKDVHLPEERMQQIEGNFERPPFETNKSAIFVGDWKGTQWGNGRGILNKSAVVYCGYFEGQKFVQGKFIDTILETVLEGNYS